MKSVLLIILAFMMLASSTLVYANTPHSSKIIRIAAFNFYPALFQAKDGSVQGFYVDFLNDIAKREGWTIEYVYGSWSDGLTRIKSGEVDILTNVAFTKERSQFMDYGKVPLLTVWAELYVPSDSTIETIRNVKGKKIALMKGDFNGANFKNVVEMFSIPCQYVEFNDFEEVFKAVSAGQVDAGVANNTFGAAKHHEYGLKSTGVIFNPFDIFFTVAKDKNSALLATLDKYLEEWRKQEDSPFLKARERWSHGTASTINIVNPWFKKTAIIFAVLLCVAVVFVAFLRIQVSRKTAEIQKYTEELSLTTRQLEEELAERQEAQYQLQEHATILRNSELRFRAIFDVSNEAIFLHELKTGAIVDVNRTMCEMYEYTYDEALKLTIEDLSSGITPYTQSEALGWIKKAMGGEPLLFEWQAKRKCGRLFWTEAKMRLATIGNDERIIVTVRDITERKQAEEEKLQLQEQLIQSQKMESIGRLAGGVAHDFNNMLSVIMLSTELLTRKLPENDPMCQNLDQITKAAKRSSEITRQLLAFSRKEIIAPKPVDLNALIIDSEKNLGRLVGEDIKLMFRPSTGLWTVLIDPTQIDQILMNLSANARDAMPDGGNLTIETANIHIDSYYNKFHPDAKPGDYVKLTICDTGHGIDQETREHIFEPFFTTKEIGVGTGLGLATVYGIVTQNKGFINVYSEPDQGTVFTIYFPRLEDVAVKETKPAPSVCTGTGTVLLVEDEDILLRAVTNLLKEIGYTVIQAATPFAAISIFEKNNQRIDMILTDVVMPGMNGRVMMERIMAIRPDIKVLFMSGYPADIVAQRGIVEEGMHYIQKPLDIQQLGKKIRQVMA